MRAGGAAAGGGTAAPAGWGRPGRGPAEARAGRRGAPALYFGGVGDDWVGGGKKKSLEGRSEGKLGGGWGGTGLRMR